MAPDSPIHSERRMRVICVGAGASGLCFAYKLKRSFHNFELRVYDRNEGVGGTWWANRYPGCSCDYEAHNYTFSWDPKPDWPSVYASAPEIRRYFIDFVEKNQLAQYCYLGYEVLGAEWTETPGEWKVKIKDNTGEEFSESCDILINAVGCLSQPKWPQLDGFKDFHGPVIHSAQWNENVKLEGKRVGLIGNGSSGQQLTEALQPQVANLTIFIRQPTWVVGSVGEPQRSYTTEEIETFKKSPDALLKKRKQFETRLNGAFSMALKDSPEQLGIRAFLESMIKEKLPDSADPANFIPTFAVGCRRPTPGVNYIESVCQPNVLLVKGQIASITDTGIIDHAGVHHELDAIVCATGFDNSHIPPFPILGNGGRNMQDEWRDRPLGYMALAAPGYPNYFVFFGPNNPFAGGAFLGTVEAQADYMLKFCDRWQTERIHSFAPRRDAAEEFLEYASQILENTVWGDACNSWFKGTSDANRITLWPGSSLHYREAISSPRAEDWEIKYNGNRFSWLGNGFSQIEKDDECDVAYYLRNQDDSEFLSRRKRRKAAAKKD